MNLEQQYQGLDDKLLELLSIFQKVHFVRPSGEWEFMDVCVEFVYQEQTLYAFLTFDQKRFLCHLSFGFRSKGGKDILLNPKSFGENGCNKPEYFERMVVYNIRQMIASCLDIIKEYEDDEAQRQSRIKETEKKLQRLRETRLLLEEEHDRYFVKIAVSNLSEDMLELLEKEYQK